MCINDEKIRISESDHLEGGTINSLVEQKVFNNSISVALRVINTTNERVLMIRRAFGVVESICDSFTDLPRCLSH